MEKPKPIKTLHYKEAVEGCLIRDIWVGGQGVDFFKTETPAGENGVGQGISLGTLVYQASTPVLLASEIHMSDGHALGYFMVGGRQPMLLADLAAFKKVPWDELMKALEAQSLKDRQALEGGAGG